jgi:hypothetical protein
MTYKQLAQSINKLTIEQQNMDVTISCDISEEVLPANYFHCIRNDDAVCGGILDEGHPILVIGF